MTVGGVYGSGRKSTVRTMSNHIIYSVVPDTLKKIAALRRQERADKSKTAPKEADRLLARLNRNIQYISGQKNPWQFERGKTAKDYSSLDRPLYTELTPAAIRGIEKSVQGAFGTALYDGMNEVYGDFREAGSLINKTVGLLAARYNVALKHAVDTFIEGKTPKNLSKEEQAAFQRTVLITKNDITQIKQQIAPLLPRVKTPMGGTIALFDFTGEGALPGSDFTDVKSTFNNKDVPEDKKIFTLHGKAQTLKYLRAVGVKPMPTITHMFDSMIANTLMGAFSPNNTGILNIHDAGITSILDSQKMSDAQNQATLELMGKVPYGG